MSACILVVDDEPDVEALFRQQFRRELRAQRFVKALGSEPSQESAAKLSSIPSVR